jgi:hypothetical protein
VHQIRGGRLYLSVPRGVWRVLKSSGSRIVFDALAAATSQKESFFFFLEIFFLNP